MAVLPIPKVIIGIRIVSMSVLASAYSLRSSYLTGTRLKYSKRGTRKDAVRGNMPNSTSRLSIKVRTRMPIKIRLVHYSVASRKNSGMEAVHVSLVPASRELLTS